MHRREEGAVATEMVLVTPLLVLLLFGIVEFGAAFWRSQSLQAGAREGARVASIGATFAEIEARTRTAANGFSPEDIDVVTVPVAPTADDAPCQLTADDTVTVTATVPVGNDSPYGINIPLTWLHSESFGLNEYSATATFRCE